MSPGYVCLQCFGACFSSSPTANIALKWQILISFLQRWQLIYKLNIPHIFIREGETLRFKFTYCECSAEVSNFNFIRAEVAASTQIKYTTHLHPREREFAMGDSSSSNYKVSRYSLKRGQLLRCDQVILGESIRWNGAGKRDLTVTNVVSLHTSIWNASDSLP